MRNHFKKFQTSNAFVNALFYLSTNTDKQKILRNQIKTLLPDKNTKLTSEHLNSFSYLKACLKEASRLYPVTPGTMRIMTKDIVIGGYQIPKGVRNFHLTLIEFTILFEMSLLYLYSFS